MRTFLIWVSFCLAVVAQVTGASRTDEPSGIKFFTGSWKALLAEAKRQNKPVFIDVYTSWCGPCKVMAREAFPNPKVGEKFNTSFISYQIDAEKGEGVEIARRYAVRAYPTSLYVSTEGTLLHRSEGYGGVDGMLQEAEKAIGAANEPVTLEAMQKDYAAGKRDVPFLSTYLTKRAMVDMPDSDALDVYLGKIPQADWSSDKNLFIISGNAKRYNKVALGLLSQRLAQLKAVEDPAVMELRNKIGHGVFTMNQDLFSQAIATENEQLVDDVIRNNVAYLEVARSEALPADIATKIAESYRRTFYLKTKNYDKFRPVVLAEVAKLMTVPADSVKARDERGYRQFQQQAETMPDSVKKSDDFKKYDAFIRHTETNRIADRLNDIAWSYYKNMPDKQDMSQALTWSAKSLDYKRVPMYLDTYAHLLDKLGRKAEAVKIEQEAIDKAKAAGEDAANYEKELADMKK
ncbi:thioredoxin family protein [Spirosoma oryzae]|nr:thioredoxin family protein [Spirosoma oryzae]